MGIMRLAKKYDAPKLLDTLKNILTDMFPEDLAEAQQKLAQYRAIEAEYSEHAAALSPETYDHEDAILHSLPDAGEIPNFQYTSENKYNSSSSVCDSDGGRLQLPRHSPNCLLHASETQRSFC